MYKLIIVLCTLLAVSSCTHKPDDVIEIRNIKPASNTLTANADDPTNPDIHTFCCEGCSSDPDSEIGTSCTHCSEFSGGVSCGGFTIICDDDSGVDCSGI